MSDSFYDRCLRESQFILEKAKRVRLAKRAEQKEEIARINRELDDIESVLIRRRQGEGGTK